MDKILLIRSSSHPEEPYQMRFTAEGQGIKLRCYCPAGAQQTLCKHVIAVASGDRTILYHTSNPEFFDEAYRLLGQIGAVAYCRQMETQIKELERAYRRARAELREKLCDILREGGSFL